MDDVVTLVLTEHSSFLDTERKRRYEAIRVTLEELAGRPVRSIHYPEVDRLGPGPVVLSGSGAPWDRHDSAELERLGDAVRAAEAPLLGICAGLQLLTGFAGGRVEPMAVSGRPPERGYLPLEVLDDGDLLAGLPARATVFQDHLDEIVELPSDFRVLARTAGCEIQAIAAPERRWWGTQFHPERFDHDHPDGQRVIANFFELAGRAGPSTSLRSRWNAARSSSGTRACSTGEAPRPGTESRSP
jgi:GMP synthase-like glutamine amidotransferase